MTTADPDVHPTPVLRLCLWCVVAVLAEVGLYATEATTPASTGSPTSSSAPRRPSS